MNLRTLLARPAAKAQIIAQLEGGEREFPSYIEEVLEYVRLHPELIECDRESLLRAIARAGSFGVPVGDRGVFLVAKTPPPRS
jgi:hypothetical protein